MKLNNSTDVPFAGLLAGAEQTYSYGSGCASGTHTAIADPYNAVLESNESNNTGEIQIIC